jgi:hypothetical protein
LSYYLGSANLNPVAASTAATVVWYLGKSATGSGPFGIRYAITFLLFFSMFGLFLASAL